MLPLIVITQHLEEEAHVFGSSCHTMLLLVPYLHPNRRSLLRPREYPIPIPFKLWSEALPTAPAQL
jgi:hypothetical protein